MKDNFITAIKLILHDRIMTVLLSVFILLCLAYCLSVLLSLRPNDLQIAVHYTAFGGTNFYREKWYYLISFVVFGLILAIIHTALAIKIYAQERRQLALLFVWLSLFIVIIAWLITNSVLRVATF